MLVHGALGPANAAVTERGVVLTEWRSASLGSGLTDVVRLARDAGVPAEPLAELYAAEVGQSLRPGIVEEAAELL